MVFNTILEKLATAGRPVALAIAKGAEFSILAIGFKKGMILQEHVTSVPAKLIVLEGSVTYQTGPNTIPLEKYAEMSIPANEKHAIFAHADSMCLLIRAKLE